MGNEVYPNYGAFLLGKIRELEETNEDELLRPEYKRRNKLLIKEYLRQLKYYEVRN